MRSTIIAIGDRTQTASIAKIKVYMKFNQCIGKRVVLFVNVREFRTNNGPTGLLFAVPFEFVFTRGAVHVIDSSKS